MFPQTPRGFRDILFDEAAERDAVTARLGSAAAAWGYRPISTPVVERAGVIEKATGSALSGDLFRLVDRDGTLLALRPEMTLPVARVVASRLRADEGPHRIRYAAEVFREHESLRGQSRQFAQFGVELIGAGGPAADAEVIALFVEALAAAGLSEFTVAVGSVAVLASLLETSGQPLAWRAEVTAAAHARNLVALDGLAAAAGLAPGAAEALRAVPRLHGGPEALAQARRYQDAGGFGEALDSLEETWRLLAAAGVSERVAVDFGVMRAFDYYTGIVLEAYAPRLGLPLGGGGRYDEVLSAFDAPAPAAGFAIGLERLMIALAEEGVAVPVPGLDAVIGGSDPGRVLAAAREARGAGRSVAVLHAADRAALVREAARLGARESLLAEEDGVVRVQAEGGEAS